MKYVHVIPTCSVFPLIAEFRDLLHNSLVEFWNLMGFDFNSELTIINDRDADFETYTLDQVDRFFLELCPENRIEIVNRPFVPKEYTKKEVGKLKHDFSRANILPHRCLRTHQTPPIYWHVFSPYPICHFEELMCHAVLARMTQGLITTKCSWSEGVRKLNLTPFPLGGEAYEDYLKKPWGLQGNAKAEFFWELERATQSSVPFRKVRP